MRVKNMISIAAIAAVTAAPTAVLAQTVAQATTDLNIRSGPGPEYAVIGAIQRNDQATILACIRDSLWCQVNYGGRQGWVYSQYLARDMSDRTVVITEQRAQAGIPTVRYEPMVRYETREVTTTGGPIGAVADGVTGVVSGALDPPREVDTYVESNPVDPVYLDGEVAVGATLPETVELRPVPDYEYRYVYVNRQPVLVEPRTRRIVYVYR